MDSPLEYCHDRALGDPHVLVRNVLRGTVRTPDTGDGFQAEGFLYNSSNVGTVWFVFESWAPSLWDDAVEFFVGALDAFGIYCEVQEG